MTSVPEITRTLAAIHTWQDGHGKAWLARLTRDPPRFPGLP